MSTDLYAHTREGHPREEWHGLVKHLKETARLAGRVRLRVSALRDGVTWRDCGTTSANPARRFRPTCPRVPSRRRRSRVGNPGPGRSLDGRSPAAASCGPTGRLLAYCIAGHHAGLPDNEGEQSSLRQRLEKEHRAPGVHPSRDPGRTLARRPETEIASQRQTSANTASRWPSTRGCSSRASWTPTSWTPSRS